MSKQNSIKTNEMTNKYCDDSDRLGDSLIDTDMVLEWNPSEILYENRKSVNMQLLYNTGSLQRENNLKPNPPNDEELKLKSLTNLN